MQLCGSLSILWHCLSLGLEWKLTFSSSVATRERGHMYPCNIFGKTQMEILVNPLHLAIHHVFLFKSPALQADSLPSEPQVLCCTVLLSCVWLFVTPWTVTCQAPLSMGILQARILEWVACHFLLQGIFLTQGWNSGLPHCRQILYCVSHQGSPWATREASNITILLQREAYYSKLV